MGTPVHSEIIIMKAFIFATVLAVATSIPIEDTEEVKAAKAEFHKAFAAAEAGEHAALQAKQIASVYMADLPEVADAKAEFQAIFDKYAAGDVALPVAPVHEVENVVAAKAVAPVAIAAPVVTVASPILHGAYPYAHTAYAGYFGYPYAQVGYPYAHATYPYAIPTVAIAPTKAE